jgi:electron transfer flavoprotein beta subunit
VKIGVCVKHVPAGGLRLDPESLLLDRSGDTELNPRDRSAVEAALRLRDAGSAEAVILLAVGPDAATESITEGLAMGADRAVLCADVRATGSDLVATSRVLSGLIASQQMTLTLFGQVAGDSDGAMLWSAVAQRLGWPSLSQASTLSVSDAAVEVRRQTERGHELLRTPLPCLVSITDAFEPRFPTFREMKTARDKPIEVVDLDALGIDPASVGRAGSRTAVARLWEPERSKRSATIVDDNGGAAEELHAFLREQGLL